MDPVCAVSPDEVAYIRAVNGGKVAGLRAVAARLHGRPAVVRVAAVVGGRPFPTLFWLVDPDLVRRISVEEAAGRIAEFQVAATRRRRRFFPIGSISHAVFFFSFSRIFRRVASMPIQNYKRPWRRIIALTLLCDCST